MESASQYPIRSVPKRTAADYVTDCWLLMLNLNLARLTILNREERAKIKNIDI